MPESFQVEAGWTMVLVDASGKHQVGRVTDSSGRRVLLTLDAASAIAVEAGNPVRIGLVSK